MGNAKIVAIDLDVPHKAKILDGETTYDVLYEPRQPCNRGKFQLAQKRDQGDSAAADELGLGKARNLFGDSGACDRCNDSGILRVMTETRYRFDIRTVALLTYRDARRRLNSNAERLAERFDRHLASVAR